MRLTKHTHACVRLTVDDRALVIDPGTWSEPEELREADAVLITHEHFDHLDVDKLEAALAECGELTVHAGADVAGKLEALGAAVEVARVDDTFTAAGFGVRAVGGAHADIYDGLPGIANLGYLVSTPAGTVYHPGDALYVPDAPVDILLVPVVAPWLKLDEAIDFVREVRPRRAYPIHDGLFNTAGRQIADRWLSLKGETEYAGLDVGETVAL